MKINKRRFLCPGCQKEYIRKQYPTGVFTYQVKVGRCRKCAKKLRQIKAHEEYRERKRA